MNSVPSTAFGIEPDLRRRVLSAIASESLTRQTAHIFKILSDPARLKIILTLQEAELCVNDMAGLVGHSQSTVSHHLKTLRDANLVSVRKAGKQSFYRLADSHVSALLAIARDHARESLIPNI